MRCTILILLGIVSLTSLGTPPAEAAGRRYPYCMQGTTSPGLSNCTFKPGAVPGHGIGQIPDVHQKSVLRTSSPPFEVVSDAVADRRTTPAASAARAGAMA